MDPQYARWVKAAALSATALASILLIIKIFAWWHTGSVSLLAALVDSLVDLAASLTNLFVVRYSLQPADEEHTFGHGKAESLAALAQSMFISGSALFLFLTGFRHLASPEPLQDPSIGIGVTLVALFSTLILVTFQRWVVRKTHSQVIRADMLHYQSDVLMNGAILIALALSWYGFRRADALFALGIGVYILYSALRMGYEAVQSLLDRALPDDERQQIIDIVTSWPGVIGAHDLRTRRSGQTRFIQLHLEMEDMMPLMEAHVLAEQVEHALLYRFPGADVLIHQDPCSVVPKERHAHWEL
ncbi:MULTISPECIES: CDF family cation-efflux transporter FieF [Yersinia pseudotuberculosis complex]|uniref:Cation-efflux pump FieF n=1 Tax=Yersinia pseudotuberculosis serotype O:1b (strain IP 31758) TaxID=349747 RepID=A0A0U1QUF7_YERP3|nr:MULTISPECIES: CDF family cation-efflux transporter FieF [Yersinia pseudotuberculosis complex]ABS46066.1 cation-efflux pump FieF [Yersinia pseudotuberculosis IP 31758]MCE4112081.1 CDF family cation-efflux transporter FieF [Yersinia pseudotuberculosis]MCF1164064.1 CDF family cation-efflux transporter FieF [Yersinia pseudotuberculosis]RYC25520.1 CDF family cation-efflux pump FieF [Yersinia pseudotuberculosis]UFA63766.1 Ferrous-iron efflux pump FieF [Yersinia pseudotuberculosis]